MVETCLAKMAETYDCLAGFNPELQIGNLLRGTGPMNAA
jgi:hypothetical protein